MQDRIGQVILLSPCVTRQALKYSLFRQLAVRRFCAALKSSSFQRTLCSIMHSRRVDPLLIYAVSKGAKIDKAILEQKDTLRIPQSTLDVLAYTACEIFTLEFESPSKPFQHPCYFGMSIYDDLLDYGTTLDVVRDHFEDLTVQYFTLPYHQPPEPPTYPWLVEEFGKFLDLLPVMA